MASKKVPFSKARQNLTSIVDEVERSGRAVTIVRRGKPAAVIIDHETYHHFVEQSKTAGWTLSGSITASPGIDIEKALADAKRKRIRLSKVRKAKLVKSTAER